ncbi:MAG: hypothetical protein HZB51_12025 [Chloroflexi bacterium]|nr:hypothetical protein [Chloroflexota bacterium]
MSILLCACVDTPTSPGTTPPTATSVPFTFIETEDYLSDLTINEHWLAWTQFDSKQYSVHVYDLIRGVKHPVPNPQGAAAWLDGDNLYILRYKLDPLKWSFYLLDLNTGQEKLLRDNLSASKTNGQIALWLEAFPDACKKNLAYLEKIYTGCSTQLMTISFATDEIKSAGFLNRTAAVRAITSDLAVFQGTWDGGVKAYDPAIEVVDLESEEYRVISTVSVSPADTYVVGANGRTVAYAKGQLGEVVVLNIEPFQQAQVLVDVKGIRARGLAGSDILLYSDWRNTLPPLILSAINMRNGEYQDIPINDNVKQFVGSALHLAWINQKEQLFVTRLQLKPSSNHFPLSTPGPTLLPELLNPQPSPVWKTPLPRPSTVTPSRPASRSYPAP